MQHSRLRYKLSLRDLPEMFLIRGIVFSHEAVRDWEAKLTPALAEGLRRRRRGQVGKSWYVDETYIKVHGAHGKAIGLSRHARTGPHGGNSGTAQHGETCAFYQNAGAPRLSSTPSRRQS